MNHNRATTLMGNIIDLMEDPAERELIIRSYAQSKYNTEIKPRGKRPYKARAKRTKNPTREHKLQQQREAQKRHRDRVRTQKYC